MKYQLISDSCVIVEAVQFDPHKYQWPDDVHSWDGEKAIPRDGSWGYTDTVAGRVHMMADDYIVEDYLGGRRVIHCETFEKSFRSVIGDRVSPIPQGGDTTIPVMTQDTQDLEAFIHRLLRAGVAQHEASREGLNYAVAMMPPSMNAKESLDTASSLLEQATKNIGINTQQLDAKDGMLTTQPLA